MRVYQVLNNNVVTVLENGKEIVLIGTGLGFKKKANDEIDEAKIQQKYLLATNVVTEQLIELMEQTPPEYFDIVTRIIELAKTKLKKELNTNLYLTLTDHIAFTIERYEKGMIIKNAFLWDIKKLYSPEYEVGLVAIDMINKELHIKFTEDEAAFIAIHIMNAEFNMGIDMMEKITKIINDVMKIIMYHCHKDIDEDSLIYLRLINHLKFFAQRVLSQTPYQDKENPLLAVVQKSYPSAYECSLKIKLFVLKEYACDISEEELVYLSIHIQRLLDS